ncbi:MAG: HYC_CC_PP family protein [Bacteroidia bacterium]
MKRVTVIFLLFLFLIANSGLVVNVHYCGGSLASIDFFSNEKHKCPCGETPMKENCCAEQTAVLKVSNVIEKTDLYILKNQLPTFEFIGFINLTIKPYLCLKYAVPDFYYPPPFKPKAPIYLLDRVFLI